MSQPSPEQAQHAADEVQVLADEIKANAEGDLETRKAIDAMKDQFVWSLSAAVLIGAGVAYVLERIFT